MIPGWRGASGAGLLGELLVAGAALDAEGGMLLVWKEEVPAEETGSVDVGAEGLVSPPGEGVEAL